MTKETEDNFGALLQKLQSQFLCCYPVNNISWQDIPSTLTWEQQQQLIDNTSGHPLNQLQPIKIGYQLNFLKKLLEILEKNCEEVHDVVYESYCQQQKSLAEDCTQKYAYKHYLLPHQQAQFTLRESKSFVAEGTTGLCSWQASLALADYLLHNADLVRAKTVLELGAGTGLCGFILARCCDARLVQLTDGSAECVQLMRENIKRNFINAKENPNGYFILDKPTLLNTYQLPWDEIETTKAIVSPEVLLAADVIYDESVFEELSHAIDYIFQLKKNQTKMLLAATVRNEHTLNQFLSLLETLQFQVAEQNVISLEQSFLFWDRSTPVKILLITRSVL